MKLKSRVFFITGATIAVGFSLWYLINISADVRQESIPVFDVNPKNKMHYRIELTEYHDNKKHNELTIQYPKIIEDRSNISRENINDVVQSDVQENAAGVYLYGGSGYLKAKINCEITYKSPDFLSIYYSGLGTTPVPYRTRGAKSPISFRYGNNFNLKTGKLLYVSDLFTINDHFIESFIKHGNEQVPIILDRPFPIYYGESNVAKAWLTETSDVVLPFYIKNGNLVFLIGMADNEYYPFKIPISEVAQDLKSEYAGLAN